MGRVVSNKHRLGRALRRHASGSFILEKAVKRVEKRRILDGLNRSSYTKSCVENYLWALVLAGWFTARKTAEGVYRFRPTEATAQILRAARAQFPGNASTFRIGTYFWGEVGPIPKTTKAELFHLLYERGLLDAPVAPAAASDADVDMDVDSDAGGLEEPPQVVVPGPVQGSRDEPPLPRTPQRPHPTQAYPSPPNTTSPIMRYHSRASVNAADDCLGSIVAVPSEPESSAMASDDEAVPGLPSAGETGCSRLECQEREQAYHRVCAELDVAQAETAEQREELQVLKLLQIDIEDRLADSEAQKEHLADECDRYKRKYWGAEAALKGSRDLAGRMHEKMAACLAQFQRTW